MNNEDLLNLFVQIQPAKSIRDLVRERYLRTPEPSPHMVETLRTSVSSSGVAFALRHSQDPVHNRGDQIDRGPSLSAQRRPEVVAPPNLPMPRGNNYVS